MRSISLVPLAAVVFALVAPDALNPALDRVWAIAPGAAANADDPAKILDASREAMTKLKSFSYQAETSAEGAKAGQSPKLSGAVSASRAEAGGWRLAARGKTDADGKEAPLHIGYDGATAWNVVESEKAVRQRSVNTMAELETFFREQGALAVAPWTMLADKPLEFADAQLTMEAEAEVGGVACNVIRIGGKAAGEESAAFTLLYVGKSDNLPRRIDRVSETKPDKEGATSERTTRTLVLKDLKTGKDAAPASFIAPTPEGFAVRTLSARKKREPREKDPLRGPNVQDGGGMLKPGMLAPDWTLSDDKGSEHKLSAYRGKVVFMDFWATWCPPCRAAMPAVQKLYEEYKGKDVVVLGMNFNDSSKKAAQDYMKKNGFTYPLLLNAEKLGADYKILGIPAFFIVGKDGRILYAGSGYPMNDKAAAKKHDENVMKIIDDELQGKNAMNPEMVKPKDESQPGAEMQGEKKPEKK